MKIEDFPIDESVVRQFIDKNKKIWSKSKKTNDTMKSIIDYMNANSIKETEYYKRGYLRGSNLK